MSNSTFSLEVQGQVGCDSGN